MNEQIPQPPNERTPGNQTSAVTRDAARLRSVMSDIKREGVVTGTIPADERTPALAPIPAYLETVMPAPRSQATELRSPAPRVRDAAAAEAIDDKTRATRLRSVASLVATRQESERRAAMPRNESIPEPAPLPRSEPRQAREGNVRHLDIPAYEREHAGPTYSEGSGGGRLGVLMALGGTLFAGLVIGVGLYAGGADMVSGLFSSNNVQPLDPNPAAITERPISEVAPVGAFDSLAPMAAGINGPDPAELVTTQSAIDPAAAAPTEPVVATETAATGQRIEQPRAETPAADVVTGSPRTRATEEPAIRTEPASERRNAPKPPKESPATAEPKPTPTASAKRYTVQVRATPDEAEARKIAKRLRGKGAKDVEVVRSEKNGAPLYRVRFKSYGTADEAQAAAGKAGFSDAWVMRD